MKRWKLRLKKKKKKNKKTDENQIQRKKRLLFPSFIIIYIFNGWTGLSVIREKGLLAVYIIKARRRFFFNLHVFNLVVFEGIFTLIEWPT